MTGQKRCCATCRFLEDMKMSGSGWCTHPKRKSHSDAKIVVRKGELACRDSWGSDFWADAKLPAEADDHDDRLAASGSAQSRAQRPDQMWLPDPATTPNQDQPAQTTRHEDDTGINEAAHLEQQDRANFMRLGPRDAINRARDRASERRLGQQRTEVTQPAFRNVHDVDATSSHDAQAQPDVADLEYPHDSTIERQPTPAENNGDTERLQTPFAPVSETARQSVRADDDIFYEIPEIRADVELPKLRDRFSIPKHRGSRSASPSEPATGARSTQFDLVLKRAREIKETKASQELHRIDPDEGSEDRVTSTLTRHRPPEPNPTVGADDEIVHFRADRRDHDARSRGVPAFENEVIDDQFEEDFELDRSYRHEDTPQQSGTRWWQTFARARVFRPGHEEPFATLQHVDQDQLIEEHLHPPAEHAEAMRESSPHISISWDDSSLAPAVSGIGGLGSQHAAESGWSSLDYLDDASGEDMSLGRLDWKEPDAADRAKQSRFSESAAPELEFDPVSRVGMDQFRDRLFNGSGERADSPIDTTPLTTHRPTSRVAEPGSPQPPERLRKVFDPVESSRPVTPGRHIQTPDIDLDDYYDSEYNPDFDLRRIVNGFSEPALDMKIMISPEIPRKCATCRSFRSSEKGSRGWCTNVWAFSHRPLVDSEDLACESTIGCWWLPEDETWDPSEFLRRLAVPTPRIDQLAAQLYGTRERMSS